MESTFTNIYHSVSGDTDQINQLFFWFNVAAGLVLLAVIFFVAYFSYKFSATKRVEKPSHNPNEHRIEIILTAVTVLVVLLFLGLTIQTMWRIDSPPAEGQKPDIVITGHQWWWEVYYPKSGVIAANEVHVPAGKRLLAEVKSADVIHSWWVPAMGRKMDMVPGHPNLVWIEARKPGVYQGMCSEFCGAQHAWMRVQVVAQTPAEFATWEAEQLVAVTPPTDALLLKGAQLFKEKTCANCHTVKGWSEKAAVGPDLTHLGSRKILLAGKELNNLETLKRWIADPQKLKPGVHMPNFILNQEEVNAIAGWLHSLK